MNINVGFLDSVLRIVVGLALISMAAMGMIGEWGWVGLIALLTGLMSRCPFYSIFDINTCELSR